MGTSKSYMAPSSGGWPAAKRVATLFARQSAATGPVTPAAVARAYVRALGGASAAASTSTAGQATARRLGGFLGTMAGRGLGRALEEAGLHDFLGADPADLILALADRLAGPNRTLDEAAARVAMLGVLAEEFGEDGTVPDQLILDTAGVARIMEHFLEEYLYQRMIQALGDRLENGTLAVADAHRAEQDIHAYIVEAVKLEFAFADAARIDWDGPEGQALVERLTTDAYSQLEGGV